MNKDETIADLIAALGRANRKIDEMREILTPEERKEILPSITRLLRFIEALTYSNAQFEQGRSNQQDLMRRVRELREQIEKLTEENKALKMEK